MNEIEYTIKLKVSTDLLADDFMAKKIGNAVIDGMNENMDENTILEVIEMKASFQATINCIPEAKQAVGAEPEYEV